MEDERTPFGLLHLHYYSAYFCGEAVGNRVDIIQLLSSQYPIPLPFTPDGRVQPQPGSPQVLLDPLVTLVMVLQMVAVNESLPTARHVTGEGSLVAVDSAVFPQIALGGEDLLTVLGFAVESLSLKIQI